MRITFRAWLIFITLALAGVAVWTKLSLPQFSSIDLSVDKNSAFKKSEGFLRERGVDTSKYRKAIVFTADSNADRYLQRALGFKKEEAFLKTHNYNLFSWAVRFYQENKKEEYNLYISSKTGEVVSFSHAIEDTESRPTLDKEIAKQKVKEFLSQNFKFNFEEFDFHEEQVKKYEKRTDYSFSWEKKNTYIPWDKSKDSGGAKLLTGATISGNEISGFFFLYLDIPEKFNRSIQNQMATGRLLTGVTMVLYLTWIGWAAVILVKRRNAFLMHLSKNFFIFIGISVFILSIIAICNDFQEVLFGYNTSSAFNAYIANFILSSVISLVFVSIALVLPGIAGESLRYDAFTNKGHCSFVRYLSTSFFTRNLSQSICLGYLVFLMVLGLQALVFYVGQKFLGVWVELSRLTELSTSYLPFLGAFIIGYRASLHEEIVFRIFGLSWAKKYLKSFILAAILVSLAWGFGHSQYPVFPIWFRGIEVGAMGLVFAFLFLRYGIICLIVAHYLFDVFWGTAAYLIGRSSAYLFWSSAFIMALPLVFAIAAYLINRPDKEREIESVLDKHQRYNLEILTFFICESLKQGSNLDNLNKELVAHGWDRVLVELAIKQVLSKK